MNKLRDIIALGEGFTTEFKACRSALNRDAIFREVASNILIHREYMNAFPAKLVIERGQVRTENSNKPHGFGVLNPETFTPFPKNPVIASFFRQIGQADELGSGMRNLMKYGKAYGAADPELVEGDIFRIVVKFPDTPQVAGQVAGQVWQLLGICQGELSKTEMMGKLGLSGRDNFEKLYLKPALENEFVEMTIPDKPRSRLQKYRLSERGRVLLAESNQEEA